jgi:hypothetical protein
MVWGRGGLAEAAVCQGSAVAAPSMGGGSRRLRPAVAAGERRNGAVAAGERRNGAVAVRESTDVVLWR